jgi:hypothetical protein
MDNREGADMRHSYTYEGQSYDGLDAGHVGDAWMAAQYRCRCCMRAMAVYTLARSGRRDDVARSSCYGCWLGACHEVGVQRSAAIAKLGAPRAVVTSGALSI